MDLIDDIQAAVLDAQEQLRYAKLYAFVTVGLLAFIAVRVSGRR